jgi:hypothetical protein
LAFKSTPGAVVPIWSLLHIRLLPFLAHRKTLQDRKRRVQLAGRQEAEGPTLAELRLRHGEQLGHWWRGTFPLLGSPMCVSLGVRIDASGR